jgi:hypothetical protein
MKHNISHDLSIPLAKQATEKAFEAYKARFGEYNPSFRWATDTKADISFKIKGVSLAGSMTVMPSIIEMDLDVPFIFKIFQKKAVEVIEDEVKIWIGKAKAGQLLSTSCRPRRAWPARVRPRRPPELATRATARRPPRMFRLSRESGPWAASAPVSRSPERGPRAA